MWWEGIVVVVVDVLTGVCPRTARTTTGVWWEGIVVVVVDVLTGVCPRTARTTTGAWWTRRTALPVRPADSGSVSWSECQNQDPGKIVNWGKNAQ